jgi:hypothetical protein
MANFLDYLRSVKRNLIAPLHEELAEVRKDSHRLALMAKAAHIQQLLDDPRHADPLRLERHGQKIFSQFDEDGIIQEIFRRIGYRNKRFVEFGVGTGIENNTVALLLQGWRGLWIEGSDSSVAKIRQTFANVLADGRLTLTHAFITTETINHLIGAWKEGEIDLLSIDIDGNDFYVLDAVDVVSPRALVLEYNAKFPPPMAIAQRYNAEHKWAMNDYYGASLEALTRLCHRRGYSLVGCNFAGANAFFVRNDLVDGKFQSPFSAENHYQPARYHLWQLYIAGQSYVPAWGDYVEVGEDGRVKQ